MVIMRRPVVAVLAVAVLGAGALAVPAGAEVPATGGGTGSYLLTATGTGAGYAPTFTGNGHLGVRVPAAGQGYAGGSVPAQSELAGFYAQPKGDVQQRANIPTWSTFTLTDAGKDFGRDGSTSGWRQQLNLHDGSVRTTATWRAPNGHRTDVDYQVFTDRARPDVAVVRLALTPRWSGTATVTDLIDGTPADQTTLVGKGWDAARGQDWETVRATGLGVVAGLASTVRPGPNVAATRTRVHDDASRSVGQRLVFPVAAGQRYTLTKYVGVTSGQDTPAPGDTARTRSADAAAAGFGALAAENSARWAGLWAHRVDVLGNPTLATEVNASQFYLWSSTRAGVDWSVSPAGLSSNGYDGHIFWDAETWMYPTLLAQHPDLARGMNDYRDRRLAAARTHARDTGFTGARFPWESALDGTEQIPPPASVNSEGIYEQHITADVALAHWQYFQATGDRGWLRSTGWPVLAAAATFWAGRAKPGPGNGFHIDHVTGPDEENPDVPDEAFTNVAAAATLRIAARAAAVLGTGAPAAWSRIANGLAPRYDPATDTHPEFAGYRGQLVKQADVSMLQYPWAYPMARGTAQHDVDYYEERSDPGGPSMTDAINSIDSAALGTPGCAAYVNTQRSIEPFIRDGFDQFSETRTGGAFTFMTGIGGFLQEFLYGYSGLRWADDGVRLDPSLNAPLTGVVLHGIAWHGSRFDVAVGAHDTRVTLRDGPPVPLRVRGAATTVTRAHPVTVPTRRPDLTPTTDVVRCAQATATSAQTGADPLAAVDGSPATDWAPTGNTGTLTVPLADPATVRTATLTWNRSWPGPPAPNVPPPPGPVTVLRPGAYQLLASADGHTWTTLATVRGGTGITDTLRFAPTRAHYLAVRITAAQAPPKLGELTVR